MKGEAAAAQPQLEASPHSPSSGDTVGRVLLPMGLFFSLLPGAGEAVTYWYGLWGLPASGSKAGVRCSSCSPQGG